MFPTCFSVAFTRKFPKNQKRTKGRKKPRITEMQIFPYKIIWMFITWDNSLLHHTVQYISNFSAFFAIITVFLTFLFLRFWLMIVELTERACVGTKQQQRNLIIFKIHHDHHHPQKQNSRSTTTTPPSSPPPPRYFLWWNHDDYHYEKLSLPLFTVYVYISLEFINSKIFTKESKMISSLKTM